MGKSLEALKRKKEELERQIQMLENKEYFLEALDDMQKYGFTISVRDFEAGKFNKKYTRLSSLLPNDVYEDIKHYIIRKMKETYEVEE